MSTIQTAARRIVGRGIGPMHIALKINSSRLRLARLFLAGCLACVCLAVRAVPQFDVFIGYDGLVREASWFPVVCEIKNDGLPISGVVEISPGNYGKGQTYRALVELPTGTMKRVVIPVFAPSRYQSVWNVRLIDERGRTVAEQTAQRARRQIGWEIPLIGSLSRTVSGAPSLRPIVRNQPEMQPAAARLQPSIFPDNPLVLEGLNAIYLSSEVAANLRASQANAILGWMNAGGHLIVGVEQVSDITAAAWLRSVLPCEPKEFKTIAAHPEMHEWLRSPLGLTNQAVTRANQSTPRRNNRQTTEREGITADAPFADLPDDVPFELADLQAATSTQRDGRVVVSCGGTPMVVTANRGNGRVSVLLFSPEREPFKSWKNLPTFWSRMVEVPGYLYVASDFNQGFGQSSDGIFGAMIDSRQVHKLPIGWLLLLLLVYLVVIGPFDQWWLKRIGKPMLTWITFPFYVVVFSLLIYFIGYKLRSGESEFNELHLVDVLRNGDRAELRGRTFASIYSPSNAKFGLESKQKFATLRGEFLGYGTEATERASVLQNGDSFKAEVFVPVWTSQLYLSDWWQGAAMPFDVTITPQADGWTVAIQNNTDHAIKSAQLVIEARVVPLGEVAGGQTGTFKVSRDQGLALRDFVRQHGQNFQQVAQQRQTAFGASSGGRLNDVPNAAIAASFVTQLRQDQNYNNFVVPPGLDLSRMVGGGNVLLLAWTPDYSPVPGMNQFKPRRIVQNTLWRVPVEIKN